jgi:sec-independent protein translocase protein TatC
MVEEPRAEHLDESEGDEEGGPVKSFLEHLEDLRWVLIKSAVALGLAMLVCLIGGNYMVGLLRQPLEATTFEYPGTNQVVTVLFGTNKLGVFHLTPEQREAFPLGTNRFVVLRVEPAQIGTNTVLAWRTEDDPELAVTAPQTPELITIGPMAGPMVAIQVALYGGFVLASPFIFYFIAAFVFPALKMKERFYVYRGLGFGLVLFMCGVAFCYFVMLPVALVALQKYSHWLGFSALQWKADEYISFVAKVMLGMGIGFEMPVFILVLVTLGILDSKKLRKGRRYMVVINMIIGGLLTPPEVVTQILMFVPLQLLYELSIWIAWFWERQRKKREAAEAAKT